MSLESCAGIVEPGSRADFEGTQVTSLPMLRLLKLDDSTIRACARDEFYLESPLASSISQVRDSCVGARNKRS